MTEAAHAVLELGDVATDGEEQVTVYIEEVMEDGGGDTMQAYTEGQEISVEELQQVCTVMMSSGNPDRDRVV